MLTEDSEDARNAEEIQKEIVEGRKVLFNYYFSLLTHIDSKISNFLSIIIITESVIVGYGGAIIKWLGINEITKFPIIFLSISGVLLLISGFLTVCTIKPKYVDLPNFISDFKTLKKGLFYKDQLERIDEAIEKFAGPLKKNAKMLEVISYLILCSIVLLLISLFLLLYFSWDCPL